MRIPVDEYVSESVKIPAVLQSVILTLNHDLHSGPVYLNKYGEMCSMFDSDEPGVHQFEFQRAGAMVFDYLDRVVPRTVYYESWSGCFLSSLPQGEEDEETGEWIEPDHSEICEIDASMIYESILGTELYRTIR